MSEVNFVIPAPVEATERVEALDTVRGFALLGILLMNICSFGMPSAAEGNPTVWGGATGRTTGSGGCRPFSGAGRCGRCSLSVSARA